MFAKGMEFTKYIGKIFETYGYSVEFDKPVYRDDCLKSAYEYDMYIEKNSKKFIIEVKYSASGKIGKARLSEAAQKYMLSAKPDENIIVVTNTLAHDFGNIHLNAFPNVVYFLNLIDIFYLVQNNEPLKEELISLLEFSVEDSICLINDETNRNVELIDALGVSPLQFESIDIEKYKNELSNWNIKKKFGTMYAKEYEKLCEAILKCLFNNELTSWSPQKKSNNDLYIFDLICRIKDDTNSEFWDMLEKFFHSKYIIFEFKNYTERITQRELYTTEKYLYEKALRKVAIIVSCNGADDHAQYAERGVLRETGKLILDITNEDLLKMIDMKQTGNYPSDYLLLKMDELMKTLEK